MNKTKTLREHVREIVCEQLQVSQEKLADDTHFVNGLRADSIAMTLFVMEYEDEFDIDIPDEDGQKMLTVNDVVIYVKWVRGGRVEPNPLADKEAAEYQNIVRTDGL